jgi:GNAT superfamily N-acetyltransferase
MTAMEFHVRAAEEDDRRRLALLFAAVAEERDGIAAEPPVDIEKRAASWDVERILVAVTGRDPVGLIFVHESPFGFGDIGMLVAAEWRGRGVGTALVAAAIEWARAPRAAQADARRVPAQRRCDRALPQVRVRRRGTSREAHSARERRPLGRDLDGAAALGT